LTLRYSLPLAVWVDPLAEHIHTCAECVGRAVEPDRISTHVHIDRYLSIPPPDLYCIPSAQVYYTNIGRAIETYLR